MLFGKINTFDGQNTIVCNIYIICISPQSIQPPKHHSYFPSTENFPRSNQSVSHLLSQSSLEQIWSLRQEEDAERSRATEGGLFSCAPAETHMEPQNGALKAHFPSEHENFEVSNLVFVGSNSLTSRSLGYTFKTAAISQHGVSEPSKQKNSMTRPIPNFSWNPDDSWQTIGKK